MKKVHRIVKILAAAVSATVALGLLPQSAYAVGNSPIVNFGSGMCLAPVADSYPGHPATIYDDNAPIEQVPCNGSPEQQWTKIWLMNDSNPNNGGGGLGYPKLEQVVYLVNRETGKCMDVMNAYSYNGARIQQYTCNGGGSEKWFLHPTDLGLIQYTNYRTHKCLDVPGAATYQIAMQQYTCWPTANVAQMYSLPA
jgi:hypothetical protein